MPEQLETLILGENELRLERIKLPNGNTYILGCSFEEAQDIYDVLSENIEAVNDEVEDLKSSEKGIAMSLNDLNSRIVSLTDDVEDLKDTTSDIETLTEDVEDLKDNEMVVSAGLNKLNSRIVSLEDDVEDLKDTTSDIETLTEDVEDLKSSEKGIAMSLNDLNSRIVSLTAENQDLRNEIAILTQEITLIKRNYMAYYDVDESKGIGEQNIYTR